MAFSLFYESFSALPEKKLGYPCCNMCIAIYLKDNSVLCMNRSTMV